MFVCIQVSIHDKKLHLSSILHFSHIHIPRIKNNNGILNDSIVWFWKSVLLKFLTMESFLFFIIIIFASLSVSEILIFVQEILLIT